MQFFKKYFKLDEQTPSRQGEYTVLCPFDHRDKQGNLYKETNPSAHINSDRSLFHCKSCGEGISEPSFISRVEGISYREALSFLHHLDKADPENWDNKVERLQTSSATLELLKEMQLDKAITELRLGYSGEGIDFPVFVYGELLDVRTYAAERKPKVKSRAETTNLIMPFDLWRDDDRPTLLCAGEKDMAIARELGYNAITFTGGEMSFPKLFKYSFKDRKVYIIYDNDTTGRDGAMKVAYELMQAGAIPYIVTGHHEVATETGGDLWDYIVKYDKTKEDLDRLIESTEFVEPSEQEKIRNIVFPIVPIEQASEGRFVNQRYIRSKVSVISVFEDMFSVPEYIQAKKLITDEESDMKKDDIREWMLEDSNLEDILHLMDSNITEVKRDEAIRRLMRIPKNEPGVAIRIMSSTNVWKSVVTDILGVATDDVKSTELLVFSVGERLMAGKKYDLQYKPVTHPLDGMRVVGVTQQATDIDSDVQQFEVTPLIKKHLEVFQLSPGESVDEKMEELYERSKGFIGVEARREVTWATDLFYHTPLEFKIGRRVERAYLDAMIIGDPRTMKSRTAKAMNEMYELGIVTSLKTATIAGLIGGSDNVGGKGWKTKIGLLPQSHRGAVIMEEFSGGGKDTISKLTEIRSSNRVRITRVNGTTDVPAMVRMLSISNPATSGGISRTLKDYPTGVHIILDLVGASEDIARYDFFLLVDEPDGYISPLDMFDLDPYEKEAYMHRIRWIWSRSAEQVEITRSVAQYIVDESAELNKAYDSHIKVFGAEAWKKVSRIAIAVAGLLVSTDPTYERIIVNEQHVDFAVRFMKSIYDNSLFKLKEYVENERSYSMCRETDIHTLQDIYNSHSGMLEQMAIATDMTQRQLQVVSGLDQKGFAEVVSRLGASRFIKWQGERIIPTGKFRQAMPKLANMYLKKASER